MNDDTSHQNSWNRSDKIAAVAAIISAISLLGMMWMFYLQRSWDNDKDAKNDAADDKSEVARKLADASSDIKNANYKIGVLEGKIDTLMAMIPSLVKKTGAASVRIPENQVAAFKEVFPEKLFKVEVFTSEMAGHTLFTSSGETGVDVLIKPRDTRTPASTSRHPKK